MYQFYAVEVSEFNSPEPACDCLAHRFGNAASQPDRHDEILNADIKRHVHPARAGSAGDLAHETRRFLHRRQKQPHIIRGYFHARHVRYTIE
ncbi:hypothetical protein ABZ667_42185 [Streptomyces lavendulae]|uniref:hypothetical protein n=1 Tax=Streptomyces lavendulae TaxID=1914 RepID=UPI0033D62149